MKPQTPREERALKAAEVALEASGLRYMSQQIDGLARLFVLFAENEIRIERRHDKSGEEGHAPV